MSYFAQKMLVTGASGGSVLRPIPDHWFMISPGGVGSSRNREFGNLGLLQTNLNGAIHTAGMISVSDTPLGTGIAFKNPDGFDTKYVTVDSGVDTLSNTPLPVTVALSVKPDIASMRENGTVATSIYGTNGGLTFVSGWVLNHVQNTGTLRLGIGNGAGGASARRIWTFDTEEAYTTLEWHRIVFTIAAYDDMRLWIDGIEQTKLSEEGSGTICTFNSTSAARLSQSTYDTVFDLGVYGRILSDDDIQLVSSVTPQVSFEQLINDSLPTQFLQFSEADGSPSGVDISQTLTQRNVTYEDSPSLGNVDPEIIGSPEYVDIGSSGGYPRVTGSVGNWFNASQGSLFTVIRPNSAGTGTDRVIYNQYWPLDEGDTRFLFGITADNKLYADLKSGGSQRYIVETDSAIPMDSTISVCHYTDGTSWFFWCEGLGVMPHSLVTSIGSWNENQWIAYITSQSAERNSYGAKITGESVTPTNMLNGRMHMFALFQEILTARRLEDLAAAAKSRYVEYRTTTA